jgi:hypothetical protein
MMTKIDGYSMQTPTIKWRRRTNTVKKQTVQFDKMRIWMRFTITEMTVTDCTPKIITDGEKENNTKAPSIEKIQNIKRHFITSH